MSINTSLFAAQSGDYSVITQAITADDALAFRAIYEAIEAHAIATNNTLMDYINQGIRVSLEGYSVAAIATLKAVGVIQSSDNVHIGLTILGYGFYQFIQE